VPDEVLLVVADDALRVVLEIALRGDGYNVRPAADATATAAALARGAPDLAIIALTTPAADATAAWLRQHAPATPHLLLVPALGERQAGAQPVDRALELPFGLAELRRALAEVREAARARVARPAR
jgi:two-component system response regulator PrrA